MRSFVTFAVLLFSLSAVARDRLPIIFVHGIWINPEAYEYVIPIKRIFNKLGYEVHVARTPSGGSLEQRAEVLQKEIKRLVPQGRFHLLGHSMGGLDSRLAIHKYGLGDRAASLTTLATPHRGSVVADYVVRNLGDGKVAEILEKLFGGNAKAVHQLTTNHMNNVFNREVKNDSKVKYFSVGFYIPRPIVTYSVIPWLWVAHLIQEKLGFRESDGMVSVESANWGESLGEYPGDHYSETGPVPLGGKLHYDEVFKLVAENLDQQF